MRLKAPYFLILTLWIFSCEVVPLDEVYEEKEETPDGVGMGIGYDSTRNVLLEYYTGHLCGNCPGSGGTTLKSLKDLYGDDLVVMTIHAGWFAQTRPAGNSFDYEFKTTAGNNLDSEYGVTATGTPKGMVNRAEFNSTNIHTPANWGSASAAVIGSAASVGINGDFEIVDSVITASINIAALEKWSSDLELKAYVTEDSIVNWQRDYDLDPEDIENYVHRYVLRGEMNVDGELTSSTSGTEFSKTATLNQGSDWQNDQLHVVVIVADPVTGEVLQVRQL
jgi:hypothetical protein